MDTLSVIIGVVLLYLLWNGVELFSNYRAARASGFKVVVIPLNPTNVLWLIFAPVFQKQLQRYLPASIYRTVRYTIHGWDFRAKGESIDTFMMATTNKCDLWVQDPEIVQLLLQKRKEFGVLPQTTEIVGRFGPNLLSEDGEDWQRHRRIIAPTLNERISSVVWEEAGRQAREMLEYFTHSNGGVTDQTIEGLRDVAINVLGNAGYGKSKPWEKSEQDMRPPPGHSISYLESLAVIADNFLFAAYVPPWILGLPGLPKVAKKLEAAVREFPRHVTELIKEERASNSGNDSNLMSILIKLTDDASKEKKDTSKLFLTENEIQGNLFAFTLAGYDTTANTMAYATVLLASCPQWQEWIKEEIDEVSTGKEELRYEDIFPRLRRCLAVMFETLRLFPPVARVSRCTNSQQQITTSSGKTHIIPAHTRVFTNTAVLQTDVGIWGADHLLFRPSRWLSDDGSFIDMPKGVFNPWSTGPRVCPGMKMAQVEFTAVLFNIFGSYKATPAFDDGTSLEEQRQKLAAMVQDSVCKLTVQMREPRAVKLKWTARV